MGIFSRCHPAVIFTFFMAVIVMSVVYINPIYLLVSFVAGFIYYFMLAGEKALSLTIKVAVPVIILAAVFNMLFARYGETVLFTVKGINFTAECLWYGFARGVMMADVILWFACYSVVFTGEKLTALFGKLFPNVTLLFSMVLRFIPLMQRYALDIKEAQVGLGRPVKGLRNTMKRYSALFSLSLEKSVEVADTMRQRGYERKGKRAFSRYRFKVSDGVLCFIIIALVVALAVLKSMGYSEFEYSERLMIVNENHIQELLFFILCFISIAMDAFWEVRLWLKLR